MPPLPSPGAERPRAEPLPCKHRQPAHTAPAGLRRHEVTLTGRSDIAAVHGCLVRAAGMTALRTGKARAMRTPNQWRGLSVDDGGTGAGMSLLRAGRSRSLSPENP